MFDATRSCESGGDTPRQSVEGRAWRQRRQSLHATALMTEDEEDAASLDNSDWRTSSQRSLPRKVGGRLLTLPQLLRDAQRSVPDKILDLLVSACLSWDPEEFRSAASACGGVTAIGIRCVCRMK